MSDDASKNSFHILVNGVVFNGNKVLISRRSWQEEHMPGRWTIPGGKVDHSEEDKINILQQTAKREVLEETGVEIENDMELVTNNSYVKENGQHVVAVVFKCRYKSGEAEPLEDTIDCKWATIDEVKAIDFPPHVKEYILSAYIL
ncbi:MAG: NUDIX domain-containing protein [Candidatus Paceibacterota bacterium]